MSDPNNFLYDFNPCYTFSEGECSNVYVCVGNIPAPCVSKATLLDSHPGHYEFNAAGDFYFSLACML